MKSISKYNTRTFKKKLFKKKKSETVKKLLEYVDLKV